MVAGGVADKSTAVRLGERLAAAVSGVVDIDGLVAKVAASVGVAFLGTDEIATADDMLNRAVVWMHAAKRRAQRRPEALVRLGADGEGSVGRSIELGEAWLGAGPPS